MDTNNPRDLQPVAIAQDRLLLAAWHIGRGRTFEETAGLVGIALHHLRPLMNYYGVRGRNVGKGAARMDVVIPSDALDLIRTSAALRGLEEVEMLERVIRLVFTSPALLENILDDGKPVR